MLRWQHSWIINPVVKSSPSKLYHGKVTYARKQKLTWQVSKALAHLPPLPNSHLGIHPKQTSQLTGQNQTDGGSMGGESGKPQAPQAIPPFCPPFGLNGLKQDFLSGTIMALLLIENLAGFDPSFS